MKGNGGKTGKPRLTRSGAAEFRAWLARRRRLGRDTYRELAEQWNTEHPDAPMTRDAVLWHAKRQRREWLGSARDDMEMMAREVADQLFAIATADLRSAIQWGPGGVRVSDSEDLSPVDAAAISTIEITETSKEIDGGLQRQIKVKLGRESKVRAASELLRFLGHTKQSRLGSEIVDLLMEVEDREGLHRVSKGSDPVRVLIDRSKELLLEEPSSEEIED